MTCRTDLVMLFAMFAGEEKNNASLQVTVTKLLKKLGSRVNGWVPFLFLM